MGNPFVHLDLTTDDVNAAKKFYKSVFAWQFTDFPDMAWTGITVGGDGVGGGMGGKQMPNQPTAWTPYVDVADVKATMTKAKKAGASIIIPFMEVGEMGALGVFIDPQGATIGVWQANKKPAAAVAAAAPKKKAGAATKKKAGAKKKTAGVAKKKKAGAKKK